MNRFTTPDRNRGDLNFPMSTHRYMYALNNPVTYNDPYGFGMFEDFIKVSLKILTGVGIKFVGCWNKIAGAILSAYDIYFAFIASFCDLLFDYDSVAGSNCALGVLPWVHLAAQILSVIAAWKGSDCWGDKLIGKLVKELVKQAATNIGQYIAKKLTGVWGYGIYGVMIRILLRYTQYISDNWGMGKDLAKFLMAPEILVGLCILAGFK